MRRSLEPHFSKWCSRSHELGGLGSSLIAMIRVTKLILFIGYAVTIADLEGSLPDTNDTIIVSQSTGLVAGPSERSTCTHEDILAFCSILQDHLSARPPHTEIAKLELDSPKKERPSAVRNRNSSSGWKTLGMGNVGSYLRIPSIPGLSSQSSVALDKSPESQAGGPSTSSALRTSEDQGADWMAISTFGLFGNKGKKARPARPFVARATTSTRPIPSSVATGAAIVPEQVGPEQETAQRPEAGLSQNEDLRSSATSDAIAGGMNSGVAPDYVTVDDELKEAIEAGLLLPSLLPEADEPALAQQEVTRLERQRVWLGEPGAWHYLDCWLASRPARSMLVKADFSYSLPARRLGTCCHLFANQ